MPTVRMRVRRYVDIFTHTHTCMHAYISTHTICMHIHTHARTHACRHTDTYFIYIHAYTRARTPMYHIRMSRKLNLMNSYIPYVSQICMLLTVLLKIQQ